MSSANSALSVSGPVWQWPVDLDRYDRRGDLRDGERSALVELGRRLRRRCHSDIESGEWEKIDRLVRPLDDTRRALAWCPDNRNHGRSVNDAIGFILQACAETNSAFWVWSPSTWTQLIGATASAFLDTTPPGINLSARAHTIGFAYLLGGFTHFDRLGRFQRVHLANRVFGAAPVAESTRRIAEVLEGWGYSLDKNTRLVIGQMLLVNRSPLIEDLSEEILEGLYQDPALSNLAQRCLPRLHRAVAELGYAQPPVRMRDAHTRPAIEGAPQPWVDMVERWRATSTYSEKARNMHCVALAKAGRWLTAEHPELGRPEDWTRETCAAWIAAIDRMAVGDFIQWRGGVAARIGEPLGPRTKAGHIAASRAFFRDCQEWGWISRRFDPARALATPRTIKALIGPDPRVIADEVWAKLLWAGLNLDVADFPRTSSRAYPIELIRAVTMTWMFSALRRDEISRLRVGCVRWQRDDVAVPGRPGETLAADVVCMLDVPSHKTGTAFTKPVDVMLGEAIGAWEQIRPEQPSMIDAKTSERVDFLFAFRARRLGATYINTTIIPALCRKAGLPMSDVRGTITSHRARATIASQLYNAKEPMTLFELQAWLGHKSPQSTQHYAKITPLTLTKAYTDAGYFARNVRTIEVLVDRGAIDSGAAANGEPWMHYDLGHGYCTYTFFEQCPHRMACAKCDFYLPKDSARAGLLEADFNLARMLTSIPLTEDERAAVEDGQGAIDGLLDRLATSPTPDGATPDPNVPRAVTQPADRGGSICTAIGP